MFPFRSQTPKRRLNREQCVRYESYRKTLREDFFNRCGYCNDSDEFRTRSFTIDHFVPQNPKDFTHTIPDNNYYNLVYSCRHCNSSKTNKWPTKDATVHNDGIVGFVDPTDDSYTLLFERDSNGKLYPCDPTNRLAQNIFDELQLWLPIHHKMWKIETVTRLQEQLTELIDTIDDPELKSQVQAVHYEILKELQNITQSIFTENK